MKCQFWGCTEPEFASEGAYYAHLTHDHHIVPHPVIHIRTRDCPPSGEHPTLCDLFDYAESVSLALYDLAMKSNVPYAPQSCSLEDCVGAMAIAFIRAWPLKICGICAAAYDEERDQQHYWMTMKPPKILV